MWYFTPFYAILRAMPDQRTGAVLMALSIICFIVLPWLDRSPVRSTRYRPLRWKLALATFVIWAFIIILGRLIAYDHVWGSWSPATKA